MITNMVLFLAAIPHKKKKNQIEILSFFRQLPTNEKLGSIIYAFLPDLWGVLIGSHRFSFQDVNTGPLGEPLGGFLGHLRARGVLGRFDSIK